MIPLSQFAKEEEVKISIVISFFERNGMLNVNKHTMLSDTAQQMAINASLPKKDFAGTFKFNSDKRNGYALIKGAGNYRVANAKMKDRFGMEYCNVYPIDRNFAEDIERFNLELIETLY